MCRRHAKAKVAECGTRSDSRRRCLVSVICLWMQQVEWSCLQMTRLFSGQSWQTSFCLKLQALAHPPC